MILDPVLLDAVLQNLNKNELYLNEANAVSAGVNIVELKTAFALNTGRIILDDETIKLRFSSEGKKIDFSTFDNYSVSVPFNSQKVAPNKGGGEDTGRTK